MTVADLRRTMSNDEWEGWVIYHGRDVQRKQVQAWAKSKSWSKA
jgi:hypothetical protein